MSEILKIWIIQKDSGICVFEQSFSESAVTIDSDLIGGFLSAILNFSDEVIKSSIQYIQLNDYLLYYDFSRDFVFVYLCEPDVSVKNIGKISEKTVKSFGTHFEQPGQLSFTGDVSKFNTFASETEQILESKSYYHKFLKGMNEQIQERYGKQLSIFKKYLVNPFTEDSALQKDYQMINSKIYEKISSTVEKFEGLRDSMFEKIISVKKKITKEEDDEK
jgi:propanediol dehydratase large subunit